MSEAKIVCEKIDDEYGLELPQLMIVNISLPEAVEKALDDSLAENAASVFRRIEYLSVIGNIAPMVGLLGTVMGMVFAFQQVANTQGSASAGDLAEGIYQALVTTVGGLIVAIPSLGAFHVFRNRVDELVAQVANVTQHVFNAVKRQHRAKPITAKRVAGKGPPPTRRQPE